MTAPHVHRGVQMRGGKPTRHCHGDPSPPRPPAPTPPQTKVSVIKVAMRGAGKPWSFKWDKGGPPEKNDKTWEFFPY